MARKKVAAIPAPAAQDEAPPVVATLTEAQRKIALANLLIFHWKKHKRLLHPVSLMSRVAGATSELCREVIAELREKGELPSERALAGEWWDQIP